MTRLAEPAWLLLLLLAPLPWFWGRRRGRLAWPTLLGFGPRGSRLTGLAGLGPWVLQAAAIGGLAVAMARPQSPGGRVRVAGRGVAIVAVVDRSSSMKAADFPAEGGVISRLDAAKATLSRFIQARGDDLIGLVEFANYPDVDAAPTLDQRSLLEAVRAIRPAGRVDDGTSLGDAIAVGLGTIQDVPARRKALVLLTDGRDAPAVARPVEPATAARLAKELGVTLHTIAIGRAPSASAGTKPDASEAEGPDLALLARLAEIGGGRSFVATDADALDRVFREIDGLEKSPVASTIRTIYREGYAPWAAAALGFLALDLAWASGRFRQLP